MADGTHSHEGLIRARVDQLGQPKISTTEAERVIIKESKSSQAGTTQNPEKFEQASYGYGGYHNEREVLNSNSNFRLSQ